MFKPTLLKYVVVPNSYKCANDFIIWANTVIYDIDFAKSITTKHSVSLDAISDDITNDIIQKKIKEVEISYDVFN